MREYRLRHEAPFWLRAAVVDRYTKLDSGRLRPCPHLDGGATPVLALHRPDDLLCAACVGAELNVPCRRCGTHEGRGYDHAYTPEGGNVTAIYRLCETCHRKDGWK